MGMSASQARMLSLTARMADLEFSAQSISNSKIRLSQESQDATKTYQDALNEQKLVVNNGTANIDATAYNLSTYNAISSTDKQRFLTDSSGKILVTEKVASASIAAQSVTGTSYYIQNLMDSGEYYNGVAGSRTGFDNIEDFLRAGLGYASKDEAIAAGRTYDAEQVTYYKSMYNGTEDFINALGYTSNPDGATDADGNELTYDAGAVKYYTTVLEQITKNGYHIPGDENMRNSEWLYNQLNSGEIFLTEQGEDDIDNDGTLDWQNVSWASGDSSITTVKDTTGVAAAEAQYETTMAKIQAQDNRFDLELKSIETEHQAIQAEMDSVKKVIEKNVDTTFKIFNG